MAYSRDTEIELRGTFRDINGALTSPTDVELRVVDPDGTLSTYLYSATQLILEGVGVFSKRVLLDKEGTWYVRFKGTGALKVATPWRLITVAPDQFI